MYKGETAKEVHKNKNLVEMASKYKLNLNKVDFYLPKGVD